jgi:hypothetical protein
VSHNDGLRVPLRIVVWQSKEDEPRGEDRDPVALEIIDISFGTGVVGESLMDVYVKVPEKKEA